MKRLLPACLLAVCGATTYAQLAVQEVASGIDLPVFLTHAGDGSGRLFVIEKKGAIRIIDSNGNLLPDPFLDIEGVVIGGEGGSERGLLGLAFHPDYSNNGASGEGKFYVNYTGSGGHTRVSEFQVTQSDPNIADPGSARLVMFLNQPSANHNGGWLGFGPDEFLYIATGDGGGSFDTQDRASRLTEPMGKIHRIDIDGVDDFPDDPNQNFGVPSDNPFVDTSGAIKSIWHYGLRNPWRTSFDTETGDMWIADVGQFDWEEVNHNVGNISGVNYGWRCREGTHDTGLACSSTGHTDPQHEYAHGVNGCSVTGGYVYRGCELGEDYIGKYIFGDFCSGIVWTLDPTNGYSANTEFNNGFNLASFGQDEAGELYLTYVFSGKIYKIINPSAPDENTNGVSDACEVIGCPADLTGDNLLDFFDISAFLNAFAAEDPSGDFTGDGAFDFFDISAFIELFGKGCP